MFKMFHIYYFVVVVFFFFYLKVSWGFSALYSISWFRLEHQTIIWHNMDEFEEPPGTHAPSPVLPTPLHVKGYLKNSSISQLTSAMMSEASRLFLLWLTQTTDFNFKPWQPLLALTPKLKLTMQLNATQVSWEGWWGRQHVCYLQCPTGSLT